MMLIDEPLHIRVKRGGGRPVERLQRENFAHASLREMPDHSDFSHDKGSGQLRKGAVGLIGVLFLTVTGAAPLTAMLGNVPFAAGFGDGIHVPAAFLMATVVLTIFSVGYAAMAGKVSSVGGFYAFISLGLGREAGLSAGIASLAAYSVFEASLSGIFAFFANTFIATYFGANIPWLYLALFALSLSAALSYLDVQLSAAVLGVALVLEVLVLLVFDVAVATAGAGTHFTLESLNVLGVMTDVPAQQVGNVTIAAGAGAVGVFMAFWSWCGFEMAPNYAEESVDPTRNVPRSLFYSVIGLGVFYTITSWCAVSAFPSEGGMLAVAVADSGNFFLAPMGQFVGAFGAGAMSVLTLTSAFACGMAFHNTAARYAYSLAREGVLPSVLARTHPRFQSPHVASIGQALLAAVIVGLFALFTGTDDPTVQAYLGVYTMLAVLGTLLLLMLQAIVSLAIIVYFKRHHPGERRLFTTVIAPAVACVAQSMLVAVLVMKLETFGGVGAFGSNIPRIATAIMVLGLVWGFVLRAAAPAVYARIGRPGSAR
jgi:amino acid transporter